MKPWNVPTRDKGCLAKREKRRAKGARAFFILMAVSTTAYASSYQGLEPGLSTKDQVDQVLGVPIKEVIPDKRYDYSGEEHDVQRISVTFYPKTFLVDTINLYLKDRYPATQLREWFSLKTPSRIVYDYDGHRIEQYTREGISFHFEASEETSFVRFVRFFSIGADRAEGKPHVAVRSKQKAQQSYQKGRAALDQRKDYVQAIRYFKDAVDHNPDHYRYYQALGYTYFQIRDMPNAIAAYARALKLKPSYGNYFSLGKAYNEAKQYQKAIPLLKTALMHSENNPANVEIFEQLARGYFHVGKYNDAAAYANQAYYMSHKRSALAHFYLGACLDQLGNQGDATYFYEQFLRLNDGDQERAVIARSRLQSFHKRPAYWSGNAQIQQDLVNLFDKIVQDWAGNSLPNTQQLPDYDTQSQGRKTFVDVYDAVRKEMLDFHSD